MAHTAQPWLRLDKHCFRFYRYFPDITERQWCLICKEVFPENEMVSVELREKGGLSWHPTAWICFDCFDHAKKERV